MQISNNVFVVTGGGSGLGAATARLLSKQGGKVVIVDLDLGAAEAMAEELRCASVCADVTSEDGAKEVIKAATALGTLRGLVNCAGVAPAEKVVGKQGPHAMGSFLRTLNINLGGTFNMVRLAAEIMQQQPPDDDGERGVIINTASVAAFDGQIGQAAYAASKGGVVAMTLPLARELARFGIRVVTIAPGIMETPMLLKMPADVQEALGRSVPFPPRLGKATEFAGLVEHVLGNGYLNGKVIRLDGAIRMAAK